MKIGEYELFQLVLERFRLDGGAMFGAVPKTLWSKCIAADENNRIPMVTRILILKSDQRLVLVDLGCGRKWSNKLSEIYAISPVTVPAVHEIFPQATDVILTHLHFDHAGGISYLDQTGQLQIGFPKAKIYLTQSNLDVARNPGRRERGSYLAENVEPLLRAQLDFTKDGQEILPGISVVVVNGHTRGMQYVLVRDSAQTLVYVTDLIPTAHHVAIPYVMGYDLSAEVSMAEKELFLQAASKNNWWLMFEHDADTCLAKVQLDERASFVVCEKRELPLFPLIK